MKVAFRDSKLIFTPDRRSQLPMFRQLYLAMREEIIAGRLAPGTRLPATRTAAIQLGIGRNTVITAYEQLAAEGYVEGTVGSGTRIALVMPLDARKSPVAAPGVPDADNAAGAGRAPKPRGRLVIDRPALDSFPFETMRRILTTRMRDDFEGLLSTDDPAGLPALREAIAGYVNAERGIDCTAAEIVITAGSLHGLDLVARSLSVRNGLACVEEPGDISVRDNLTAAGAELVHLRVDGHGCVVEDLIAIDPPAKMVVITPSNQYPLGGTMSLQRRLKLLEWCHRKDVVVFEDDADSEFRYATRPLAPLKALDRRNSVIYAGTFSRILHPSLRLGYLILPPARVSGVIGVRQRSDRHPPPLEQALVAEFIARGHFAIHVRKMRKLYRERQAAMVAALRRELPAKAQVLPAGAGINLLIQLPRNVDDVELAAAAARLGCDVHPLSCFYAHRPVARGLLAGCTAPVSEAENAVKLLCATIRQGLRP